MIKCNKCNIEKPYSSYYKNKGNPTGYLYSCKKCIKIYNNNRRRENKHNYLLYTYNITIGEFEELLKIQNNKCAICNIHENDLKEGLCVDHCHESGKVRGLLCHNCNHALGKLKDDINLFNSAIEYLIKNKIK